jgi:N-acetylglutamate synthase-like GNAT family acetyltransferase
MFYRIMRHSNSQDMIRRADRLDVPKIRALYRLTGRPERSIRLAEYFVAEQNGLIAGCAAVRQVRDGGYLYGLAVHPSYRRQGIGSALTVARLQEISTGHGTTAIVLAMFWNVSFFKRLGFKLVRRDGLPNQFRRLADLRAPLYKRSAVLSQQLTRRRVGSH